MPTREEILNDPEFQDFSAAKQGRILSTLSEQGLLGETNEQFLEPETFKEQKSKEPKKILPQLMQFSPHVTLPEVLDTFPEGVRHGYDASEGSGEGVVEIGKEMLESVSHGIPGVAQLPPKARSKLISSIDSEKLGSKIEPFTRWLGAAGGGVMGLAHPVMKPLMAVDRTVRSLGEAGRYKAAATGDETLPPEKKQALIDYALQGEISPEAGVSDYETPSTGESTLAGTLAQVGTDFVNYPLTGLALAKGMQAVPAIKGKLAIGKKGSSAPEVGVPKSSAVDKLQSELKPGAETRFGQEFEVAGKNALRLLAEEEPKVGKGTGWDRGIESSELAKNKLKGPLEEMISESEARGDVVPASSVRAKASEMTNDPYYKYIDTEAGNSLKQVMQIEKDVPVREAQKVLSSLNKQMNFRKQTAEAQGIRAEKSPSYEMLENLSKVFRDELNQKVSRRANEFLENYRDFSNLSNLELLLKSAKTKARNMDKATITDLVTSFGVSLPQAVIIRALKMFGRNKASGRRIDSILKEAQKEGLEPPEPMKVRERPTQEVPIEQPSEPVPSQPQPTPAQPTAPRNVEIPQWALEVQKATRDPVDMLNDIELIDTVVRGKSKKSMGEIIKDPSTSAWAKNIFKRLAENPEDAVFISDFLKHHIGYKVDPFKYGVNVRGNVKPGK